MKYIICFSCLVIFGIFSHAQILKGKVVNIADGDTFTLLDSTNKTIKIRLHGIDCPEKKQDFGNVAKIFTINMISNKMVEVQQTSKDRYGRTVGIVFVLPTHANLNEALLKAGLAWHYTQYDHNKNWQNLEDNARYAHIGLWQQPNAIAPWIYRKERKKQKIQNSFSE